MHEFTPPLYSHNSFIGAYGITEFQGYYSIIILIIYLAEIKSLYSLEKYTILKRMDSRSLPDPLKGQNFFSNLSEIKLV